MPNTTEYIITADGKLLRHDFSKVEIEVGESVLEALTANVTSRIERVMEVPGHGYASVAFKGKVHYWTLNLPDLVLKSPFRLVKDTMVPLFAKPTPADSVLELVWTPPESMRLYLVVEVLLGCTLGKSHLFAYSANNGSFYRLPLANLYETCQICLGTYVMSHQSHLECIQRTLAQLRTSHWNSDLWTTKEYTEKMFRFEAIKDGFKQLPPDVRAGAWEKLCEKVAPPIINNGFLIP